LFPQDTDHLTHTYTEKKYYYNTPTDSSSFSDHDVNCIFSQTVLKWSMGGMGGVIGGFFSETEGMPAPQSEHNGKFHSSIQQQHVINISNTHQIYHTTHGR
jgi:hypothetical protein